MTDPAAGMAGRDTGSAGRAGADARAGARRVGCERSGRDLLDVRRQRRAGSCRRRRAITTTPAPTPPPTRSSTRGARSRSTAAEAVCKGARRHVRGRWRRVVVGRPARCRPWGRPRRCHSVICRFRSAKPWLYVAMACWRAKVCCSVDRRASACCRRGSSAWSRCKRCLIGRRGDLPALQQEAALAGIERQLGENLTEAARLRLGARVQGGRRCRRQKRQDEEEEPARKPPWIRPARRACAIDGLPWSPSSAAVLRRLTCETQLAAERQGRDRPRPDRCARPDDRRRDASYVSGRSQKVEALKSHAAAAAAMV